MSKARNYPSLHRINRVRKHNRDRRGRALDGEGCGSCDHYDDVNVQSNHLRCKLLKSVRVVSCISALNDEVPTLHVSELSETLKQRVIETFVSACDKPHPPDFSCQLLRPPRKRPPRHRPA